MPGVNGATKLNNVAPNLSAAETKSVSAFKLSKKPKIEEKIEKIEQPSIEILEEEHVEEPQLITVDEVDTVEAEVEPQIVDLTDDNNDMLEVKVEPVIEDKTVDYNAIVSEFDKLKVCVKELYDKVFSKTPNFRPTYDETVGDALLYIGKKLAGINAFSTFEEAFKVKVDSISDRFLDINYIPLVVKLSVWAEKKGLVSLTESVLSIIMGIYKDCAEADGVITTPESITNAFLSVIDFAC